MGYKCHHIHRKVKKGTLSNNKSQHLTAANLVTLHDIFESHNWHINIDDSISCFQRFTRTLSTLTPEEQCLILSLTERFKHFPKEEYSDLMIPLLIELRDNYPDDYIYFVRCCKEEDVGKIKSCDFVLYQLKGTSIRQRINLGKYRVVDDLSFIEIDRIKRRNAIVVFVDDYVGTGETAMGALNYFIKCLPQLSECSKDRFCFLTLAAYSKGKTILESNNYKVYASFEHFRGISDYYEEHERLQKIQIMNNIERRLSGLSKKFRFGYGQTEGLICMERCPNNTFPIYWFNKGDAPYER